MILFVDNFDSFTFNLVQLVGVCGAPHRVVRNDAITLDDIANEPPAGVILSPGPGAPRNAGICTALVRRFAGQFPILGVCLGHQCIAEAFGARIVRAPRPRHGVTSRIAHDATGLFAGLPAAFPAARYHSLAIAPDSLDEQFEVNARSMEDDVIMAFSNKAVGLYGVQFHPESFMTPNGFQIISNFVRLAA